MIESAIAAASRVVTGAHVEWRCCADSLRARLYFANHSSHLDFLAIWSALPPGVRRRVRPVAGRDYWDAGIARRYLSGQVFHALLVDRAGAPAETHARASIRRMAGELDAGHSLIIFPEGTRSADGRIAPFKSGLYHLSRLRPDTELVPVYLDNLNRILPKGELLPLPLSSRVVFGAPYVPDAGEGKREFLERARAALIALRTIQ